MGICIVLFWELLLIAATMNIQEHVLCEYMYSLNVYLGMELLHHKNGAINFNRYIQIVF